MLNTYVITNAFLSALSLANDELIGPEPDDEMDNDFAAWNYVPEWLADYDEPEARAHALAAW